MKHAKKLSFELVNLSNSQARCLLSVIEIIELALLKRKSEKKLYIPLSHFPSDISKFDIAKSFEILENEFKLLNFLGFVNGENEEVADITFQEQKKLFELKKLIKKKLEKIESAKEETKSISARKNPYVQVKNGMGFLFLSGEEIEIGKADTGKYRLLQSLCEPEFGMAKTIEGAFEAIKLERYFTKGSLRDPYLVRGKKIEIIKSQFKEIQRTISEYRRENGIKNLRLKMKIDTQKVWLEQ